MPVSHTIVADSDCILLSIPHDKFTLMEAENPEIALQIMRTGMGKNILNNPAIKKIKKS